MQTTFISSEHDRDPPVVIYSLMRDLVHRNVSSGDDEIRPKEFIKL